MKIIANIMHFAISITKMSVFFLIFFRNTIIM